MQIQPKRNNMTAGEEVHGVQLVHCREAGTIKVHFSSGDEDVILAAGDDRSLSGESITIVSGKFDVNC